MDLRTESNVISFDPNARRRETDSGTIVESRPMGSLEREIRDRLIELKSSKYPDTFDWGVYDKIADRYGENQPRGGVVFKTGFKLINHHASCVKCHYAFEIDAYGRGCLHNCAYCYAKEQLTAHGYWNRPIPFPIDLVEVRKAFYLVFETDRQTKWREIMERRIPLRVGSMSDSFMWSDQKYRVAYELLKILKFYRYPYIIATRSDLVAQDEYLSVLDPKLATVQMSIAGVNEAINKKLEPGAPSIKRRFAALKLLNERGFWTSVRINPLFPIYPDGYFTDPDSVIARFGSLEKAPKFDLFDWSLVDQIRDSGTPSFLAGFVRLSKHSVGAISRATGLDFNVFFKPENVTAMNDRKYSDAEIRFYYRKIREDAHSKGLRFNTCYIGNGEKDYYQYQELWSNKSDCCDARGNVSSFSSSSQEISWDQRIRHASCKMSAQKAREQSEILERQMQGAKAGGQTQSTPNSTKRKGEEVDLR